MPDLHQNLSATSLSQTIRTSTGYSLAVALAIASAAFATFAPEGRATLAGLIAPGFFFLAIGLFILTWLRARAFRRLLKPSPADEAASPPNVGSWAFVASRYRLLASSSRFKTASSALAVLALVYTLYSVHDDASDAKRSLEKIQAQAASMRTTLADAQAVASQAKQAADSSAAQTKISAETFAAQLQEMRSLVRNAHQQLEIARRTTQETIKKADELSASPSKPAPKISTSEVEEIKYVKREDRDDVFTFSLRFKSVPVDLARSKIYFRTEVSDVDELTGIELPDCDDEPYFRDFKAEPAIKVEVSVSEADHAKVMSGSQEYFFAGRICFETASKLRSAVDFCLRVKGTNEIRCVQ